MRIEFIHRAIRFLFPVVLVLSAVMMADASTESRIYDLEFYGADDPAMAQALNAYHNGQLNQARPVLEGIMDAFPEFGGRHSLSLILADIATRSGDPNRAESLLIQASTYPPLQNVALARLSALLLSKGEEEGALDSLAAIRPGSPQYAKARYDRARLLLKRGQYGEAINDAEDALMEASSDKEREKAKVLLSDIWLEKGEQGRSYHILKGLWWSRPANESSVMSRLTKMKLEPSNPEILLRDLDSLSRYTVGKKKKDFRKRFKKYKKRRNRGLRTMGEAWLRMHIRKERSTAPEMMEKALKETQGDPVLEPWARLGEALALRKVDRDLEAAEGYLQLIEEFPEHHLVPRALLGAGQLLIRNQLPLEGERALRTLVADYPQARERAQALWELAWSDYLGENHERSISFLDQLMRAHPTEKAQSGGLWRERALYWRARCLGASGNIQESKRTYRRVLYGYPLGYYALLSANRLREIGETETFYGRESSGDEESLDAGSPDIERNPTLDTAVELLRVGLLQDARRELQARLRGGDFHADGVNLLLWVHQLEGRPGRARAAMRKYASVGAVPNQGNLRFWKETYPVEYENLVDKFAVENGLSSFLVYAVIRQESHFNPRARSYASALGLMQLLAPVARSIAVNLLGYKRLAARDLYKPHINIEIGTRMIRELHMMYRGNTALAIASYNAGPYAVKEWVQRFGHLATDEFVEMIPYRGTASYTKKVLGAASVFGSLYHPEGKWEQELSNTVPVTLGPYMKKSTDS